MSTIPPKSTTQRTSQTLFLPGEIARSLQSAIWNGPLRDITHIQTIAPLNVKIEHNSSAEVN
jgi:hypothetical protein